MGSLRGMFESSRGRRDLSAIDLGLIFDRGLFRAWLAEQPPDRLFRVRSICDCPLSVYYYFLLDVPVAVDAEELRLGFGLRRAIGVEPVWWITQFVLKVDSRESDFITVAEALQLLDEVPNGE